MTMRASCQRARLFAYRPVITTKPFRRCKPTVSAVPKEFEHEREHEQALPENGSVVSVLSRMSTTNVLRNIILGAFFSSPTLFSFGFSFLRTIAETKSPLLNPDRNPILRVLLKPVLYNQFCAGVTRAEIQRTRHDIKSTGYAGIVLCYGKEIQISRSNELRSTGSELQATAEIDFWKKGNLETLDMVGTGDWLGMKFTGAGNMVVQALMKNEEPPTEFIAAMHEICSKAAAQHCRIWVDAEQQVLQKSIDLWTIDLMRKYNVGGKVVVYNTVQAYLKTSRAKLIHQLALADKENWTLAIKLVRGAYIDNDQRQLIHDTKEDTDESYNGIVKDMLAGTNLGFSENKFPKNVRLIIAGHNPDSVSAAWDQIQSLQEQDRLKILPDFGQLQGMGDVVGCRFLQQCDNLKLARGNDSTTRLPEMFKCLTWGSMQECMQYLFRRAVENGGGTDRMRDGLAMYVAEMRRRIFRPFGKRLKS